MHKDAGLEHLAGGPIAGNDRAIDAVQGEVADPPWVVGEEALGEGGVPQLHGITREGSAHNQQT